jgi:hypothetical protein
MLVLPDDVSAHPYQTSMDVVDLAPNAEVSIYPWKESPETKAQVVEHVRGFLKKHQPVVSAR